MSNKTLDEKVNEILTRVAEIEWRLRNLEEHRAVQNQHARESAHAIDEVELALAQIRAEMQTVSAVLRWGIPVVLTIISLLLGTLFWLVERMVS